MHHAAGYRWSTVSSEVAEDMLQPDAPRLWPPWLDRVAARTVARDDDIDVVRRKKYFFLVVTVSLVFTVAVSLPALAAGGRLLPFVSVSCMAAYLAMVVAYMLCARQLPNALVYATIAYACGMIALFAFVNNGDLSSLLAYVIVIDVLLVLRMPRPAATATVAFSLVVTTVLYIDLAYGIGLVAFLAEGNRTTLLQERYCACASPPCHADVLIDIIVPLFNCSYVFLLDFLLTRHFAEGVAKEHAKVETSIQSAHAVAELLALFDLEAAEELLDGALHLHQPPSAALPEGMRRALAQLLHNLRCYRPYIPNALFDELHADAVAHSCGASAASRDSAPAAAPPGSASGTAAVARVGVVGADRLWDRSESGMRASLRVLNRVLRATADVYGGYEVRAAADAFAAAFESVPAAVRFALAAQEALMGAAWPMRLERCGGDGGPLWCGLPVRIGVGCGDVDVVVNALTARADYFGPAVNTAARLEAACPRGGVAVPAELVETAAVSEAEVAIFSMMDKEGGDGSCEDNPQAARVMYPIALAGRWSQHRDAPQRGSQASSEASSESPAGSATSSQQRQASGPLSPPGATPLPSSLQAQPLQPLQPLMPPRATPRTKLKRNPVAALRSAGNATVGSVESLGSSRRPNYNRLVATVTSCLSRSSGTVVSLTGHCFAVAWNAALQCPAHVEHGLRFASLLTAPDVMDGFGFYVGVCTADVMYGTVGNAEQRFLNVFGEGVGLSRRLGEEAMARKEACLYVNLHSEPLPRCVLQNVHVVAEWGDDSGEDCAVVHRVDLPGLERSYAESKGDISQSSQSPSVAAQSSLTSTLQMLDILSVRRASL